MTRFRPLLLCTAACLLVLSKCSASLWQKRALASAAMNTLSTLLADKPWGKDEGLYLYRLKASRGLVVQFYARLTGSGRVTRAILSQADRYDIDLPLAFSLAWAESGFQVGTVNDNGGSIDRGLFQLNTNSFPFLKEKDFFAPEINARYGLAHLRFCLEETKNEVVALAMYNAGKRCLSKGTPLSTLHHIGRAMEYKEKLKESFRQVLQDPLKLAALFTVSEEDS